jgi:hypothetical protein
MNSIYNDDGLRAALYRVYVAQFEAISKFPTSFTKNDANRMLTSLMGSRPWSWRVVGITDAALEVFAAHDFKRVRGLVERGHLADRSQTAYELFFNRQSVMELGEFFEFFLERDKTVLMAKYENKSRSGGPIPLYTPIPMERELFPCGTLIGWQHRPREIEFLRQLHSTRTANEI